MSSKLKKIRRDSLSNRNTRRRDTRSAGMQRRLITIGAPDPCNCPICAVMAQPDFADDGTPLTDDQMEQLMAAFAKAEAMQRPDAQDAFSRKMDAYIASVVGEDGDYFEYLMTTPDDELTDTDRDMIQAFAYVAAMDADEGGGWLN